MIDIEPPADIFNYDKEILIVLKVISNKEPEVKLEKNILYIYYTENLHNKVRKVERKITLPEDYIYDIKEISFRNNVLSIRIEKKIP